MGLLLACEDSKKQPQEKAEMTQEVATPEPLPNAEPQAQKEPEQPNYPVLTRDNVVEFLTNYGKENPETKVRITSQYGVIELELYKDTPIHRANFIYLVKRGYFDNTFFHRVVPDFIIQAGSSDTSETAKKRTQIGSKYLLPAELSNGRRHTYGTVSGAKEYRKNPDKKTMPFEFFIFLGPDKHTTHLNGNYTIFARVTQGMDVVETISELEADEGEWPINNVYIKAEIIE